MAESVETVYSTALFELCDENSCIENVYEELQCVRGYICGDENFEKLLCSPIISADDKEKVLITVFDGKINDITLDFLCLLARKMRMNFLPAICREFKNKYNDRMNILEVTAVTSQPLSDRLKDKLKTKLEKVSGKNIVLSNKVDEKILGGIVLRYGNTEIDSSVKSRLDGLKKQIEKVIV